MPRIAGRLDTLPDYPMARVPQRKRELLAAGVDVIDLGPGDADLMPPPAAQRRLAEAVAVPAMNRYGYGPGLPEFRDTIAAWMGKRFGLRFDPDTEIVPLIGSKEGISHLALAYLDPGQTAIVPEPGYNCYAGGARLAGGEVYRYALRAEHDFLVELDEIPDDVLRRARVVYLNYPNNPTGAIAPRDYLERTVRRCRELDLLLVYDNAYSELGYDGYVPPSIFEIDGARDVAIEFHSMSKTYNMTGWRCGWAVARPEIASALARVKTYVDTGAFKAVQASAVAAIESYDEFVPRNVAAFRERRDAAVGAFREAGFACESPKATIYLWIPLPEGIPSALFAQRLLDDEGVIVLAGSGFGDAGEGYFRVAFINGPDRLTEAARRAGRVLQSLTAGAAAGAGAGAGAA